ncbi:hypothetical protein RYH80_16740 [Halobaculum sp. MBLA0147]|uniref:hypothetical protein n=1 Tax=Halobaculum sp. MBLA0147 TaxID=3079934 RepID=UPI0035235BD5
MATVDEQRVPRDGGFGERVVHLAEQANPAFAAGSVVVPLAAVALTAALGSTTGLFYTHVVTGAIWFGFALVFPAVVGPVLGGLDDEAAWAVTRRLTPKVVFFVFGTSLATVVSGTILLGGTGLSYGYSGTWPTVALASGWGLFLFGLVVPNRLHLREYYLRSRDDPDEAALATVERRILVVGLFEAVAMLGIIVTMTGLRLGV